jgi:hypothetical protein
LHIPLLLNDIICLTVLGGGAGIFGQCAFGEIRPMKIIEMDTHRRKLYCRFYINSRPEDKECQNSFGATNIMHQNLKGSALLPENCNEFVGNRRMLPTKYILSHP